MGLFNNYSRFALDYFKDIISEKKCKKAWEDHYTLKT